jgi:hypothetical protein
LTTVFADKLEDQSLRLQFSGNYPFLSFFKRMIKTLDEEPEHEDFNKVCNNAYPEYKGKY